MRNDSSSPRRIAQLVGPRRRAECPVPEWQTVEWKHRVEAEARSRLKKQLRGKPVQSRR